MDHGRIAGPDLAHDVPVLPAGWAPLNDDQQSAVLRACAVETDGILLRLGSPREPGCEYRVYRLAAEGWAGLSVVSKYVRPDRPADDFAGRSWPNLQLLGLASDPLRAIRIAVDFFNWDLEAHGQAWRLDVQATTPNRH